jgi:hypothetical protein
MFRKIGASLQSSIFRLKDAIESWVIKGQFAFSTSNGKSHSLRSCCSC